MHVHHERPAMVGLEEAAIIDGATPLQTLIKIVLPLSTASIATIGLFYAVWHWNEWFYAFLCVYPFIQRYFVKGIMIGSIKG